MSSHDTPNIYAELLTNIRQLSVAVTLPSPAGGQTKALIAPDGATLHIHHAGTETSFPLPGRVLAQAGAPTALPTPPPSASSAPHTLSWRLPLADSSAALRSSSADDPVPWTARDLLPGSAIACRRCAAAIVPGGKAGEWKDLPSENWAEMMDFWHCHKPSTDHEDEHEHGVNGEGKEDHEHLTRRGYGANSSIAAQPGVGMVDLTSFLFCEADCVGLKVSGLSFSRSISVLLLISSTSCWGSVCSIQITVYPQNTGASRRRPCRQQHATNSVIWSPILRPYMNYPKTHAVVPCPRAGGAFQSARFRNLYAPWCV